MSETLSYPFPDIPEEGAAIEVAQGILWMRLPLPMKLDHVNIYALDDGDSWTIVDTGFYSKRGVAIWEKLLAGPLGGKPVGRVIVTHHHPDHIGMAGWFQSEHGAELVTTRTAWLMARMLVLDEQDRPTQESLQFWKRAGMAPEIYAQRAEERPFNFADCVAPMPLGYRRIREGDVISAGERDWTVRIGNGHAPEHATFWTDGLVLGGDQLLPSISPNLGVYPTEPEADPVADWLEACERLGAFATPDQLVLPGHKLPFTGLSVRMRQLVDNHHGALERLLDHLDTPKTAHECFLPLFKREIRGGEYGLALVESVAHCAHLYLSGQATRMLRDDGAYTYQRSEA
ncbi:MBL fold metallo-hydrolase [Litoreibacter janthinus]|uniref:Glyoxylase, beta-lactamase superfamily II n=1 Tax=Litoreibacter janthinus TaxID=670154 RepID=A0A1I6G5W4_9RHOB|nr:MBL fold metallo-hydrolase [Litoreibacter janthinus]SFR37574.1 Glyoxylase, beta-lactamase superfamily II [Litoreibacter janthinus]